VKQHGRACGVNEAKSIQGISQNKQHTEPTLRLPSVSSNSLEGSDQQLKRRCEEVLFFHGQNARAQHIKRQDTVTELELGVGFDVFFKTSFFFVLFWLVLRFSPS